MRSYLMCGNWKMNTTIASGVALIREIASELSAVDIPERVGVAVCPPFPVLGAAAAALRGTRIALGAQHVHWENDGAYTGEVSAAMLVDCGCTYVIVGHSERRQYFHETDESVNRRSRKALSAGLTPVICLGELLTERDAGITNEVVARQLDGALEGFDADMLARSVLAYEPVWAIGTGKVATPEQAQEVHAFIRARLAERFGSGPAQAIRILYGGSMKPDNARELLKQPDVDGGLIGGASLSAAQFVPLVRDACALA